MGKNARKRQTLGNSGDRARPASVGLLSQPPLREDANQRPSAPGPVDSVNSVSLWRLFLLHLRVGNLTFGGGDPTLAAMHSEIVATRGWISSERYAVIYALARITPGTNLLAFCAGISFDLRGWIGAVVAVLAMTAPAALVVVLMTSGYDALRSNPLAMAAIGGILASAVGMMAAATWQLASPHMNRRRGLHLAAVAGGAIALSLGLSISPILVVALAAAVGAIWRIPE